MDIFSAQCKIDARVFESKLSSSVQRFEAVLEAVEENSREGA